MKGLNEDEKRALDIIYPLTLTYPIHLARLWQQAKKASPRLTKAGFLQNKIFKWPRDRKRHPMEAAIIRDHLEKLNDGETQLADLSVGKMT
jgi:hypothetical protein